MRNITRDAVQAFFNGQAFSRDITTVSVLSVSGDIVMHLHGSPIAYRNVPTGVVEITTAGYVTNTTKERLNGILEYMGQPKIYQHNSIWYWQDGTEFPTGWTVIKIKGVDYDIL